MDIRGFPLFILESHQFFRKMNGMDSLDNILNTFDEKEKMRQTIVINRIFYNYAL